MTAALSNIPVTQRISATDRLGLTLFIALALHLLVILGIGFELDLFKQHEMPLSLEIILVHKQTEEPPEQADYLAQLSQRGGGEVPEMQRPSSPEIPLFPHEQQGDAAQEQAMSAPPPVPDEPLREVMTTEIPQSARVEAPELVVQQPTVPAPSAADLMQRSREIARVAAEIQQRQQTYAQMPRERSISANTRESVYAAYQDAWRQKVERIGNLNYPDDARRQGLSGTLLLVVSIRADGSLTRVEVLQSSGYHELDEGAMRIVRMAAPYAPFPAEMRKETDILHITRVWQFQSSHQLDVGR